MYTTSFRSEQYIRGLFRCYGIKFDNIVNGARHAREVQAGHTEAMPSKYPSKYRIDLHIDDDRSVAGEWEDLWISCLDCRRAGRQLDRSHFKGNRAYQKNGAS